MFMVLAMMVVDKYMIYRWNYTDHPHHCSCEFQLKFISLLLLFEVFLFICLFFFALILWAVILRENIKMMWFITYQCDLFSHKYIHLKNSKKKKKKYLRGTIIYFYISNIEMISHPTRCSCYYLHWCVVINLNSFQIMTFL